MPRPRIYNVGKTERINATVTPVAKERLQEFAKGQGMTLSEYIEQLARSEYLKDSSLVLGESLAVS